MFKNYGTPILVTRLKVAPNMENRYQSQLELTEALTQRFRKGIVLHTSDALMFTCDLEISYSLYVIYLYMHLRVIGQQINI